MRVGLNLIFLVPEETGGMEVYARELIPALLEAAPQARFTAFINRETASYGQGPWTEAIPSVTVPVSARQRVQWVLGEQAMLPRLAAANGIEVMHSLASTAPAWGACKRVVTVHDLIYARFPEAHAGMRALGMRALVPLAARRSDRVIAISKSTKADLMDLLGVPERKIDVIPQGLGSVPGTPPGLAERARARMEIGQRQVILSLSAKRPHKNLTALIGALAQIAPEKRPLLVLCGYGTWHEEQLREQAHDLGMAGDVRFLGWVGEQELEELWSVADAFIYPSLYEGFGLPVLEAMARGVPVACSDASSLPEVAGEAALLFAPESHAQIAAAIERLLGDRALTERLRAAGLARAATFTWARTASMTLESYWRAIGLSPQARRTPRAPG
jgi:glycosyltransferase involved in cell wall biosynthesis